MAAVLLRNSDVDAFFALASSFNGVRSMAVSEAESDAAKLRRIHETAFNHTTLMALQVERHWTYLQVVMPSPSSPSLLSSR